MLHFPDLVIGPSIFLSSIITESQYTAYSEAELVYHFVVIRITEVQTFITEDPTTVIDILKIKNSEIWLFDLFPNNVSISYCNIFIAVGTVRLIPWADNSQNREFTHFRFHGAKTPVPWHSVPLLMTLRFQVYGSSVCGQMKNEKKGSLKIKLLKISTLHFFLFLTLLYYNLFSIYILRLIYGYY